MAQNNTTTSLILTNTGQRDMNGDQLFNVSIGGIPHTEPLSMVDAMKLYDERMSGDE